jgi:uncharacterized membrane protein
MSWLLIAIIAHFLFALVFVIDKFLLSKTVLQPIVYAFYTGILQIFVLVLIPFGFAVPPSKQIIISFIAGALFTLAVLFLYKSFQMAEVSRITPIVGGAVPLFTLVLSYSFLEERLAANQLFAFSLLVLGGTVMFWPRRDKSATGSVKAPLAKRLPLALLAALFFAGSFVLTKFIFIHQPFINGFIWIRLGGFLIAVLLFLWPGNRQIIFEATKALKIRTVSLFFSDKALAGLAFILLNYAIYLGSVTLVNALQGVQYVFLLVMAIILSKKFPQILEEQVGRRVIFQKFIAILLIGLGLGMLAF